MTRGPVESMVFFATHPHDSLIHANLVPGDGLARADPPTNDRHETPRRFDAVLADRYGDVPVHRHRRQHAPVGVGAGGDAGSSAAARYANPPVHRAPWRPRLQD